MYDSLKLGYENSTFFILKFSRWVARSTIGILGRKAFANFVLYGQCAQKNRQFNYGVRNWLDGCFVESYD